LSRLFRRSRQSCLGSGGRAPYFCRRRPAGASARVTSMQSDRPLLRVVKVAWRAEVPGCASQSASARSRHDSGQVFKEVGQTTSQAAGQIAERRDCRGAAELPARAGAVQERHLAGCDEAGRGPLAGPVVAAAVVLDPDRIPKGIDDSKRLTAEKREELFEKICATSAYAVAVASPARIDRDNILRASLWALARAVHALPEMPKHVFVDGRDRLALSCDCEAVIGGDGMVVSIAAASIIAKVTRDRLMSALAQ